LTPPPGMIVKEKSALESKILHTDAAWRGATGDPPPAPTCEIGYGLPAGALARSRNAFCTDLPVA
jgi:hypothetical protein